MTIADSRVVEEACRECGMPCTPTEYHPYAACLMFRGCHNSKVVRENLRPLSLLAEAERQVVAETKRADDWCLLSSRHAFDKEKLQRQNDALQSRLDAVVGLLGAAVCPMAAQGCDGTQYPVGDPSDGGFHGEQCQWCHERNELRAALGGESPGNDEVGK